MEDYIFNIDTNLKPQSGRILISEPMLADENFHRSVIYLCSHSPEGSLGFVFNNMIEQELGEFVPELEGSDFPVYVGGPVDQQSMHIIHRKPKILGGEKVSDDLYLGADIDVLIDAMKNSSLNKSDIKFFLGYSGWGPKQLDQEIAFSSWLVADCTNSFFFEADTSQLWKEAIRNLGDDFKGLLNLPSSPELN